MVEVTATGKNLRVSPKKVRPIAKKFRGQPAEKVLDSLRFVPRKGAVYLAKVLKSAMANAKDNKNIDPKKLIIKDVLVDEGASLKRTRPVSRGSAHRILKRTSQIKVVLEGK